MKKINVNEMSEYKIDILLATYNGEKFIEQQLLSILAQSNKNWRIIAHDDGSTDGTLEILKRYELLDSRITVLDDGVVGLGAAQNFLHLLQYSTSEYIALCDQDDIWLDGKLEIQLAALQRIEDAARTPSLVYCNAYTYSTQDGVLGTNVTYIRPQSLNEALFMNGGVQGCAMLFNAALRDCCFPLPNIVAMHDHVITLTALTYGKVEYIDKALILYRQHSSNVTGRAARGMCDVVTQFFTNRGYTIGQQHYLAVKDYFLINSSKMEVNKRKLFEAYIGYPTSSFLRRFDILLRYNFKLGSYRLPLLLKNILRRPLSEDI
ncbi:glycosyltransferase family 2 protein [Pseudomonas sp. S9]|uniref:glycosyltransferase family 2 protein n=1 Tax=Pseudomonas sp. S9 TaxID=686578 RepID=UPI0002556D34|nr:glycosyltransferase family 2 protein [Pseudomonas sp. S9]